MSGESVRTPAPRSQILHLQGQSGSSAADLASGRPDEVDIGHSQSVGAELSSLQAARGSNGLKLPRSVLSGENGGKECRAPLFAKAGKNAEKKCRDPTWRINNGQVEGQVTK